MIRSGGVRIAFDCCSIVAILLQYCSNTVAVLWQYCCSIVAILLQYCGNIVAVLWQYCCSIVVSFKEKSCTFSS